MLDSETKRRIDTARDILVGKVPNPSTQVEQITFAMIYKFMDDMDQQSLALGGKASFFTNGYEQYAWSNLLDKRLGGANRLDLYVRSLEAMAQNPHLPPLFRDIFRGAFLPYRDAETLNLFLKEMNEFNYTHSEDLGDAYEYLLSVFATQGNAGQFRTPRHIIDFIVDCVNPGKNDTVLDPACGTAGFLVSAYKHIIESNQDMPLTPDEKQRLAENFTGYDISPEMVRLSRVNMYLHQFQNPTIFEYDTLTSEDRWDDSFDVILANPPFMSPKGGIRPHTRFAVQAKRSEVLFVDYIAEHLNPGGRAGVIVPEGIIFQAGKAYKALRKMLVDDYLFAVVSLPQGIFNPYSSVKTSILLLDKVLAKRSGKVLFIQITDDGYDLGATRAKTGEGDLPEAKKIILNWKGFSGVEQTENTLLDTTPIKSIIVGREEIAASNDYRLSMDVYVKEEAKLAGKAFFPIGHIISKSISTKVGNDNNLPVLSMTMKNGLVDQSDKFKKRIASKDISTYKKVAKDNLVVGFPIDEGVLGVQTKYPYAAVSPAYKVWELKKNLVFLPYLEIILRSDEARKQYRLKMQGTAGRRRTLDDATFLNIKIPLPPLEVQQAIVDEIEGYQKIIDGARQVVENYKPVIKIDPTWQLVKLGEREVEIIDGDRGVNYPKKEEFTKEGHCLFLNTSNVRHGEFNFDSLAFISEARDNKLRKGKLIRDDVVLTTRGTVGNIALYDESIPFENVRINSGMVILRSDKLRITPSYLMNLFLSTYIESQIIKIISGSAQPQLPIHSLIMIPIPLPSIEIQNQLVSQIQNELILVNANNEIIRLYEKKIEDRIKEVWGEK